MSIQNEITRIQTAKEDLKTAINAKGGSLADETLDHYAQAVTALPEAGTDTSDATATAEDIILGYTAYVKGEKIRGTHECESYDISVGTATAADILEGKTAFAGNGLITGTIPVRDGFTVEIAPGVTIQRSAGYYSSPLKITARKLHIASTDIRYGFYDDGLTMPGSFTGNATATAADILAGKTAGIRGEMVTGTLIPSSTFYKCTAVDTEAKTWSGQKAVLSDGAYSFEGTVTSGLSYENGIIPHVGGIYSSDSLVLVKALYSGFPDGLVFWAPLDSDKTETETGQTLTETGNVVYTENGGRRGAYFDGSSYLSSTDASLPFLDSAKTLSVWLNFTDGGEAFNQLCTMGDELGFRKYGSKINFFYSSGGVDVVSASHGVWYHCAFTWDGTTGVVYINGVQKTTCTIPSIKSGPVAIGALLRDKPGTGYVSDVRIYNRALTAEEVLALYETT